MKLWTRRSTVVLGCGLVLVLTAVPGGLAAQEESAQKGEPERPFVERVEVNLVNIEVSVSDKGNPVYGLRREDFVVVDDGEEVEVTNFYAVEEGLRKEESATDVDDSLLETPIEIQVQPSFVVILVDNSFIAPANRKLVIDRLRGHLETLLDSGARVMVVNKDREIEIVQGFTTDRAELDQAIDAVAKTGGGGAMNMAAEQMALRQIELGARPALTIGGPADPAEADAQTTFAQIRAYAEEVSSTTRRSTAVLSHFINSLSGLEGRKAIVYVADQLPFQVGERLFNAWFDKYNNYAQFVGVFSAGEAIQEYDNSNDILDLVTEAATNRVTFYPVGSGENATLAAATASSSTSLSAPSFASRSALSDEQGLRLLARETGGEWASNLAELDPVIETMATDLAAYYSIGYLSPHGADSKRHRVKVSVRGHEDFDLRFQTSYVDKDADRLMTDRTLSALLMDSDRNPLAAWVEVGEPERQKRNRYVVPIVVKLPLANLALIPEDKVHVGSVSVFVVVQDGEGRISEPRMIPVPVSIPNARFENVGSTAAAYATRLALRRAQQTIAIGLRDDISAVGSTLRVELDVGNEKR